jgi:hypothetical protein
VLRWSGAFLLATILLGAAYATGQAQDKGSGPGGFRYKVVKVPGNIIDMDYNTNGNPRKPAIRPVNPLDDLGAEGWELVTALPAEGGEFVLFFRRRK